MIQSFLKSESYSFIIVNNSLFNFPCLNHCVLSVRAQWPGPHAAHFVFVTAVMRAGSDGHVQDHKCQKQCRHLVYSLFKVEEQNLPQN